MKITLLGYGEMGHAMEALLSHQHELNTWDPYIKEALPKVNSHKEIQSADAVIFCTPTEPVFDLSLNIASMLKTDTVCLSMAKALDSEGRTATAALQQGLPVGASIAVLYGPMIAEEIIAGRPAFATVAGSNNNALKVAKSLFADTALKLQSSEDINGITWCAVLKNIYATLFGMADELRLGTNVRGFLAVATLQEMADIMVSIGGQPGTPYSLAGLGDLITTGTSENSHHHELGRMVARDERSELTGEGINTLDILKTRRPFPMEDYPIMQTVWHIMRNNGQARELVERMIADWCQPP